MPTLVLKLNRQKVQVASIHDAQLAVRKLSEEIGGTEFYSRHPRSGAVLRRDGRIIGHLSYNARFWPKGMPHTEVGPNNLGDRMHVVHDHTNPKESEMSKKAPKKATAPTATKEPVVVTTASKKAEAKAAKVAKPPKAPKAPKPELVVFAFRLTAEERDAIHKAAGPAKASKFIRALAIAAASNDRAQVDLILKGVMTPES